MAIPGRVGVLASYRPVPTVDSSARQIATLSEESTLPPAAVHAEAGSWASSPAVRRSMQHNRPRDTALEVAVRSGLHRVGLRFYKHRRPIPGLRCEPDILFPAVRLAVFIDGCFWHACPEHASLPKTNGAWWRAKLEANQTRDRRNDEALRTAGWTVLRVWEHRQVQEIVAEIRTLVASLPRRCESQLDKPRKA
jgi:DNA mismatch endonuclease, patch repair protein